MTHKIRVAGFFVAAAMAGVFLLSAMADLPDFGEAVSPYRNYLATHAVDETHATDLPSAINFDYRALDTLGEEYILFVSVAGVTVLLREPRRGKKHADGPAVADDRCFQEALVLMSRLVVAVIIVFGFYLTIHAHLTPGGGFQGGAVLSTAVLMIYLARGHEVFARNVRPGFVHRWEAVGAAGYVVAGLVAICAGGAFLENVLPLGETGQLLSAGLIPLISLAVGLEVSGGFSSLYIDFISELHRPASETEP